MPSRHYIKLSLFSFLLMVQAVILPSAQAWDPWPNHAYPGYRLAPNPYGFAPPGFMPGYPYNQDYFIKRHQQMMCRHKQWMKSRREAFEKFYKQQEHARPVRPKMPVLQDLQEANKEDMLQQQIIMEQFRKGLEQGMDERRKQLHEHRKQQIKFFEQYSDDQRV